jgi:hypothetical protein
VEIEALFERRGEREVSGADLATIRPVRPHAARNSKHLT